MPRGGVGSTRRDADRRCHKSSIAVAAVDRPVFASAVVRLHWWRKQYRMVQMHPTLGLGSGENLKFEICLPACGPCPAFLALATNYPTLRPSSSKWRQFEGKERERGREGGYWAQTRRGK